MKEAIWDYRSQYVWMEKTENRDFPPMMIECNITGAYAGKETSANIPETIDEQVEAVYAAYCEGAVVANVRARDPKAIGHESGDPAVYSELNGKIRAKCPGIIISNPIGDDTFLTKEQRTACLFAEVKPDLAALTCGILMLGTPLKERKAPLADEREETAMDKDILMSYGAARGMSAMMRERGIKPQLQIYQPGQYHVANDLLRRSMLDFPVVYDILFGFESQNYTSIKKFYEMVREMPKGGVYFTGGCEAMQLPMNMLSIINGGHVRVGLADSLVLLPGEKADSTAQQTARIREMAEKMGRKTATPDEARAMLGITRG